MRGDVARCGEVRVARRLCGGRAAARVELEQLVDQVEELRVRKREEGPTSGRRWAFFSFFHLREGGQLGKTGDP